MSRYINTAEIGINYQKLKVKNYGDITAVLTDTQILSLYTAAVDMCNTADVVSRDQFNDCYEECLRLRTENEHLMDCLREKEDDRK